MRRTLVRNTNYFYSSRLVFSSVKYYSGIVSSITASSLKSKDPKLSGYDAIIDVREADELKEGKIENSQNIPLGALIRDMGRPEIQKLKKKSLLVYCKSGGRSTLAANLMGGAGFDVTNMVGGFKEWSSPNEQ